MRLIIASICVLAIHHLAHATEKLPTGAQGAPPPRPMPSRHERNNFLKAEFKLLDGNNDRRISKAEYLKNSPRAIAKAEGLAKKHGYEGRMVSQFYAKNRKSGKFPAFSDIDKNGDGRIQYYEEFLWFPSPMFSFFSTWDLNGDRKVTKPEYLTSRQREYKARFVGEQAHFYQPPTAIRKRQWALEFAMRDRNKDGRVTWAELRVLHNFVSYAAIGEGIEAIPYYALLDANFDGVVSRDEYLANARKSDDKKFLHLKQKVFRLRDLNGDQSLSLTEFAETGENAARGFVAYDKDGDGVLLFENVKGAKWVAGKSLKRDRSYFDRLDANQDRRVTWKEFRSASTRGIAFGAIDHLNIDHSISRKEWNAIKKEYLVGQKGNLVAGHAASGYATNWFPGIFDFITFDDVDSNKDGALSWKEFETFPN